MPTRSWPQLHKIKIDDMFTSDGTIRADGLLEHEMYIMQVKKPPNRNIPGTIIAWFRP